MEGTSIWRKELGKLAMKPVGKDELEAALEIKWGKELRVNPKNFDRILALMPPKTKISLVANAGVSLNEIQVFDGIPMPRLEWEMPKQVRKSTTYNKDRIPVAFIKSMLEKGSSEKEIRSYFKETHQIISLSQIRAIQENRMQRKYISVKKIKEVPVGIVKEKRGRKRRDAVAEMGAAGASNVAPNESKTRKLRGHSPRIKNRNSKGSKKV